MGTDQSKPLQEYSSTDIASGIRDHGAKFSPYAEMVEENGVNGEFLSSLDESELKDTLEDLGVVNRLHARMLLKKWQGAQDYSKEEELLDRPPSVITTQTSFTSRDSVTSQISAASVQDAVRTAQSYGITDTTPESELTAFEEITAKAMEDSRALYAGVHLLDQDGGHLSLSSCLLGKDGTLQKQRVHAGRGDSRCYTALIMDDRDYIKERISPEIGQVDTAWYVAHVVRGPKGERIGMVCTVKENDEDTEEMLKELAAETERQLELRKVLACRNQNLREQIYRAKNNGVASSSSLLPVKEDMMENDDSSVVAPAYGPLKSVTASQVAARRLSMPCTNEPTRRSSMLPSVQAAWASKEQMAHLPDDYYDELNELGGEETPVPKDDMERVAFVASLGLTDIDPNSTTAVSLQRLVKMASDLFDFPYVELALQTHDKLYGLARRVRFNTNEDRDMFYSSFRKIVNMNRQGEPFLCERGRSSALCNYPLALKKTFVVHDLWQDESFAYLGRIKSFRFYSGTPIWLNGYIVATLCLIDFQARYDFGPAQEIQQEQIAQLIEQQFQNYVLRREMDNLEKERRLLIRSNSRDEEKKDSPPDESAALIFTDVQGSTALWEANGNAMNEALVLHDKIMRKCCAENHGYEVITEGDAFHLAFHDAVDAVRFALQAQRQLYDAPWSEDILALKDGCDDAENRFRGLRVRMAIHCGPIDSVDNQVTGRREYTGPTYHVAKSVERMSHGGQILTTSDVWKVASFFAESSLDSPQVIDLGTHVLWTGRAQNEGIISKGVVQLVPASLSYDYFTNRKLVEDNETDAVSRHGRQFPPVITQKQQTPSFHDAPHLGNTVTICFVYTSQVENQVENSTLILAALAKLIGGLVGSEGYHCKNFMIAFTNISKAVKFGIKLQKELSTTPVAEADLTGLVQVGVHEGVFTSMGPSPQTGRADYFGTVVNRAARVAGAAAPGQVLLGATTQENPELDEGGLKAEFLRWQSLKGVQHQMALFQCSPAMSKTGH